MNPTTVKNNTQIIFFILILFMNFSILKSQPGVYSFTGSDQYYQVPDSVYSLEIKLWGAGGAKGYPYQSSATSGGGPGGYTFGIIAVTPGETLTVMVGQGGLYSNLFKTGNYGGGGDGFGQGGGRSAVRRDTTELITAGGGGGGSSSTSWDPLIGGAGGGLQGKGSINGQSGGGGTQTAGGSKSSYNSATAGQRFKGGGGTNTANGFGSGGGGGYFGGGGANVGIGGGGSGFLGVATDGITIASENGQAPNSNDPDYQTGIAAGGTTGEGGHGLVVIHPSCRFTPLVTAGIDTVICSGDSVLLSANAEGSGSYSWEAAPGLNQLSGFSVYARPQANATYVVRFYASAACFTTDTVAVQVIPLPNIPVLDLDGNTLRCTPDTGSFIWFRNGEVISGADSASIVLSAPGNYRVSLTEGSCSSLSEDFSFDNTGINKLNGSVNVYPNPADGLVMVKPEGLYDSYRVYSITGQLMNAGFINNDRLILDTTEWLPGLYFIVLEGKEQKARIPLLRP
jgi:hypothetical protein